MDAYKINKPCCKEGPVEPRDLALSCASECLKASSNAHKLLTVLQTSKYGGLIMKDLKLFEEDRFIHSLSDALCKLKMDHWISHYKREPLDFPLATEGLKAILCRSACMGTR